MLLTALGNSNDNDSARVRECTGRYGIGARAYIRLHSESGDSFFGANQILGLMKKADLTDVNLEEVATSIWFSPSLAKQELSHAQVWYDEKVEKSLGGLTDTYGMKYPALHIFSGIKQ